MQEFDFIEQMHNHIVEIDGSLYQYRIVNNFPELQAAMMENAARIDQPVIIAIVLSIEGMHVLNCGIDPDRSPGNIKANPDEVKQHAKALKEQERRPWFITFSHHFYNEL